MQAYEHSSSSGQTEFAKNKLLTIMHCCTLLQYYSLPSMQLGLEKSDMCERSTDGGWGGTCNSTGGKGKKNSQGRNPRNTVLLALVYR